MASKKGRQYRRYSKHRDIQRRVDRYGEDPKYLAACRGKARYTKESVEKERKKRYNVNSYKCKYCDHWHIGRKWGVKPIWQDKRQ